MAELDVYCGGAKWSDHQIVPGCADGNYDEAIRPIRDGVRELVDAVLARKRARKPYP